VAWEGFLKEMKTLKTQGLEWSRNFGQNGRRRTKERKAKSLPRIGRDQKKSLKSLIKTTEVDLEEVRRLQSSGQFEKSRSVNNKTVAY
jgi:hypothetical protein